MNFVSCFRYVDRFLKYLRSKTKVVLNRAEVWTFFAIPNFKRAVPPQILYISDNSYLMARHVAKFHGFTPPNPKVIIGVNTQHFKPIVTPPLQKNCWGTPIPSGVWASKTWPFCGTCKNFGAQQP